MQDDPSGINDEGDRDDDEDGWVDEAALLSANERAELIHSIRPIKVILIKVNMKTLTYLAMHLLNNIPLQLRKLAYKILHSTTILLPVWKSILEDLKLAVRIMPCDVSTRWNSTYDMLNFALEYRKGIDAITDKRKLGLGEYELKPNEWLLVKQFCDILKDATLFFSRSTPNLAMVIPAMDHIDHVFTSAIIKKEPLDPAIGAGLRLAKHTLNRYYSLTDASKAYRIAMGVWSVCFYTYIHSFYCSTPSPAIS
ncbi:hypothetical protein DFH29DRAFT_799488 [Suillus ampliporus]|nr:hypothetical protein DFH29DRAFT_799488 [Suillus ampliporus]